jgi:nitric oxide reductase FlRd-NAD(+) reductase
MTGIAFAQQQNIELFANTKVTEIDSHAHTITANDHIYHYSKLVFATGARTFVPTLMGNATNEIVTLNSLNEFRHAQEKIASATRIVIMGGGLIGTELAMDLIASNKHVQILEPGAGLMGNLLPNFVAHELEKQLRRDGVEIARRSTVR